jgi:hypothetical protein
MTPTMTKTDPKSISDQQLHIIMGALHYHPDDVRIVDLPTHSNGYFAAQAAGFALIAELDEIDAMLGEMPRYYESHGDVHEDGRWFEVEDEAKRRAMTAGCIHALRIVKGQGRHDHTKRRLENGVAMLRLRAGTTMEALDAERARRQDLEYADMDRYCGAAFG